MPKYNVSKVTEALTLVKAGEFPHQEIAKRFGMGLSTLSRHIMEYRAGRRPEIDIGELTAVRAKETSRKSTGVVSELNRAAAFDMADTREALLRGADEMDARADNLAAEIEQLRANAAKARSAAEALN